MTKDKHGDHSYIGQKIKILTRMKKDLKYLRTRENHSYITVHGLVQLIWMGHNNGYTKKVLYNSA